MGESDSISDLSKYAFHSKNASGKDSGNNV